MLCDYCHYADKCTKIISKHCNDFKSYCFVDFQSVSCGETYYVIMQSGGTGGCFVAKALIEKAYNNQSDERDKVSVSIFDLQHENKCFSRGIMLTREEFEKAIYKTKEDAELIMNEVYINR